MLKLSEIIELNNEAEQFLKYMDLSLHKKNVFLYGCGEASIWYIKFMQLHKISIIGFIDGTLSGEESKPIMGERWTAMTLERVHDNYDDIVIVIAAPKHENAIRERINEYATDVPVFSFDPTLTVLQEVSIIQQRNYIVEQFEEYKQFWNLLSDEWSRKTLEAVLKGRFTSSNRFYKNCVSKPQYFPDVIMKHLTEQEVFLDVGAYTGDSIDEFVHAVGDKFKKVIAFEPDASNVSVAVGKYGDDSRIEIFAKGASSSNGTVCFSNENGAFTDEGAHVVADEDISTSCIEVIKLDDVINESITYLKMDIEGMEGEAIEGAKHIIKEYHPKLAISVYHRVDDILRISKQIMEIDSDYKLYLRHYWESCGTDTILFAI